MSDERETDTPVFRVPISLPCNVPVVPGTWETNAPIEERTERCASDAWWMVGRALICDRHLRVVMGDAYPEYAEGVRLSPTELLPWEEAHRYAQDQATPNWEARRG